MNSKFCIPLFALLALTFGAPVDDRGPNKCAKQCSNPVNVQYQPGNTYVYKFLTTTRMELGNPKPQEISIAGLADITNMGSCEFGLKLREIQVTGVPDTESYSTRLQSQVLPFSYDDGEIPVVCPGAEEAWVLNIKKAILSGLQLSKGAKGSAPVIETDIMGTCETTYRQVTDGADGLTVKKTKKLSSCSKRARSYSILLPSDLFSVAYQKTKQFKSEYECTMVISKEKVVKKVHCLDSARPQYPIGTSRPYNRVSIMELTLQKAIPSNLPSLPDRYEKDSLLYQPEDKVVISNAKAEELLYDLCREISTEVTSAAPHKYKMLTYGLKGLDYEGVKALMDKVSQQEGIKDCKAPKLSSILASALIMSGGPGALQYLTKDFTRLTSESPESIFTVLSLPFLNNPPGEVAQALVPFLQNSKCPKLSLFASALIGSYLRKREKTPARVQFVEPAVDVLASKLPANCEDNAGTVVTYLKAIGNIGHLTPNALSKIVGCTRVPSDDVRTAAIDVFRRSKACNCPGNVGVEVKNVLENILKVPNERDEVAVAAFKAFMTCSEGYGSEFASKAASFVSSANPRLAAYARSYISSVNRPGTPSPEKLKMQKILNTQKLPAASSLPNNELPSRHEEFSYYSKLLDIGFDVETDVIINKGSNVPRAMSASVGLPVLGKTIDLVEVGLRQEGVERDMDSMFGERGIFTPRFANYLLQTAKDIIEGAHYADKTQELKQKLMILLRNARHMSVYVNYNGNTLLYISSAEFEKLYNRPKREADNYLSKAFEKILTQLGQGRGRPEIQLDAITDQIFAQARKSMEGFGSGFHVKAWIESPTVSGMPVKFGVSLTGVTATKPATAVASPAGRKPIFSSFDQGYNDENVNGKTYKVSLLPSFALAFGSGIFVTLGQAHKIAMMQKQVVSSNFAVLASFLNNGKDARAVEIRLPKNEMNVVNYKRGLYSYDGSKLDKLSAKRNPYSMCTTPATQKMLGYDLCMTGDQSPPSGNFHDNDGEFNLIIRQSDLDMNGWTIAAVSPPSTGSSAYAHIILNTPGSKTNRLIEAKINGKQIDPETNRYDYVIGAPFNQKYGGNILVKSGQNMLLQLSQDQHLYAISRTPVSPHPNFKEKINFKLSNPVLYKEYDLLVSGSSNIGHTKVELVSNSKDGKNERLINAELKTEGKLLRPKRAADENFRSALILQIGNPQAYANLALNLQNNVASRFVSLDAILDYKCSKTPKAEKLEINGKIYNKGNDQQVQIQSSGELISSEYPVLNGLFSQKFVYKPREQIENELLFKLKSDPNDKKQKFHLHQVTKMMKLSDKDPIGLENKLKVYVGPLDLNRELYHKGSIYKHELELRDGNNPENVHKAKAYYDMFSESPVKAAYGASYRSPNAEYSFSEEVNEVSPNHVSGKGVLKRQVHGQPPRGYYIDTFEVTTSNQSYYNTAIKVSKIENNENVGAFNLLFDRAQGESTRLDTTLYYKGSPVFTLNHYFFGKNYQWQTKLNANEFAGLDIDISRSPAEKLLKHKVSANSDMLQFFHDTSIVCNVGDNKYQGANIESSTTAGGVDLYKLNIAHTRGKSLKASLNNDQLNMKFTKDTVGPNGVSVGLDFQKGDLVHKTAYIRNPSEQLLSLSSETKRGPTLKNKAELKIVQNRPVLVTLNKPGSFEIFYESKSPNNVYLRLSHEKTGVFHETSFTSEAKPYSFNFKSNLKRRGNEELYDTKVTGFFVSPTIYEVKAKASFPKDVGLAVNVESSSKKKVVNVDLKEQISSSVPVNYLVSALKTAQKTTVRMDRKVGNQITWSIDGQYEPQGITAEFSNPDVLVKTKIALTPLPRTHTVTVKGKKHDYDHETSLTFDGQSASLYSRASLNKQNLYQFSGNCTKNSFKTYLDQPQFTLNLNGQKQSNTEATYNIDLLTKYNDKKRAMQIKRSVVNPSKPTLKLDIEYLDDVQRAADKKYLATATIPLSSDNVMTINYDSKDSRGCEGKLVLNVNRENCDRDLSYTRKCPNEVKKLTVSRRGSHSVLIYSVNDQEVVKIEGNTVVDPVKRTLVSKITVKSPLKPIDGSYLDIKAEAPGEDAKFDLASKLPFFELVVKANGLITRRPYPSSKVTGSLENLNNGNRFDLDHTASLEKKVINANTVVKKNNAEKILTQNLFYDGKTGYVEIDAPPYRNKFTLPDLK